MTATQPEAEATPAHDEAWLRELLVRSLRSQGLRGLCKGEPATHDDLSNRLSIVLTTALMLGIVFSVSDWTNAGSGGTLAIGAGVLLVLAVFILRGGNNAGMMLLVGLWLVSVVTQVWSADSDVWATIGVPFLLTAASVAIVRTRRLAVVARSAPLVLPVTLSVLVIPLFTSDLWSAVHGLHAGNLVVVALLSLVPLLVAVERRLRREVDDAVLAAGAAVDADRARADLHDALVRLLPEEEREAAGAEIDRLLEGRWEPFATDGATSALIEPMRRRLWRAVANVAVGLAMLAGLYMGAMSWVLIPIASARDWTGAAVEVVHLATFGLAVDVPVGPYLIVATLLGLLAAAVLLASVAVDQDYAERLAAALLREPAAEAVATLVPYLRMRDASPPTPTPAET